MDLLSAALDESGIDLQPVINVQPPIQRAATSTTVAAGVHSHGGNRAGAGPITNAVLRRTGHPTTVVKTVTPTSTNNNVVPGQPVKILLARPQTVVRQQVVAPGSQIVRIQRALAPPGTHSHRQPTLIKVRAAPMVGAAGSQPTTSPRGQAVHVVRLPTKQVALSRPGSSSATATSPQIRLVQNGSPVLIRTAASSSTSAGTPHVVRVGVGGQPKVITRVLTSKGPAMIQSPRVVATPAAAPSATVITTTAAVAGMSTRIIQAPARVVQSANGHTIIQRVVTTTPGQATPMLRGVTTTSSTIRPHAPVTQIIQKVTAPAGGGTSTTVVRKLTNGIPPRSATAGTTAVLSRNMMQNPRSLLVASRTSLASNPVSANTTTRVSVMPPGARNQNGVVGDPGKQQPSLIRPQLVDDGGVEEEEELGVAETYSNYVPAKLRIGLKHPDPVVETASLSSVPPPDVHYRLTVPEEIIDTGALSALQLESITYACQQHDVILPNGQRAGYLIGDGPGIGKGRTVAGIIFENYLLGRKRALWFSVSNDLRFDAERDLRDIGASKLDVHPLNKFKYHKITSKKNGSCKRGVIFATYSSLIGESSSSSSKYRTRLKQLLHWCGEDFDGVIVFDECHKAKNLYPAGSSKPTKTGQTVLELQNRLPKARVVYASATGASEPKNMAYMTRLGIWGEGTQFKEFNDFLNAVEKRGVGSMELVAMDMKLRGMYIARQLSFSGVTFRIEEVSLQDHFVQTYNLSVKLWVEARRMFSEAAQLMDADTRVKKTMWGQFWGAHQRFFKYLCIAAKVPYVVKVAKEAIKDGKCVVIGLQSTGESRTLEQLEEQGGELTDFVSTAKGVFQSLVEKHFPAPNRKKTLALLGLGGSFLDERDFMPKKEEIPCKKESEAEDSSDAADSSSDLSESEDASDDSDEDDLSGDDFNPFGGDNGDEDDPWANRSLKRKRKKKDSDSEKKPKRDKKDKKKVKSEKEEVEKPVVKKERSPSPFSEMTQQTLYFSKDSGDKAAAMKLQLLNMLENIGEYLPINTLDQLIDELGGPTFVAEMTGRKGRLVNGSSGVLYESRTESDVPLEILNVTEKQRFMNGEKNIAIISEAASSGISLQADRRAENRKRRLHITLELPWSADRAVQQFGRTHRSNQVSAPEYLFLISDLAGERRFASIVAKRIESMGALTHGDRRAGESRDLSVFNIDNNYGRMALEQTMKAIMGHDRPMVKPPSGYDGDFFQDCKEGLLGVGLVVKDDHSQALSLDKDYNNISKFLNRLLGLKVTLQNALFKYFMDTMDAVVSTAKKTGRFDMGILDLGANADNVKRDSTEEFVRESPTGSTITELHTVRIERGMSWLEAIDKYKELCENDEGFYSLNQMTKNGKKTAILAVYAGKTKKGKQKEKIFRIFRPHTGLQMKQETLADLKSKYTFLSPDDAQDLWQAQYESSEKSCSHIFGSGFCNKRNSGHPCDVGLRSRTYHVLAGSVFTVWSKIETALSTNNMNSSKLQVVRLKTEDDLRIVGTIVPPICVHTLRTILAQDAKSTSIKKFNNDEELQAD